MSVYTYIVHINLPIFDINSIDFSDEYFDEREYFKTTTIENFNIN